VEVPPLSKLRPQVADDDFGSAGDVATYATPCDWTVLMTDRQIAYKRIHSTSLHNFIAAVHRIAKSSFHTRDSGTGLDLQVGCALLPAGKRLWSIRSEPQELPAAARSSLLAQLDRLAIPMVRGPVAFLTRLMIAGGAPSPVEVEYPFCELFEDRQLSTGLLDQALLRAAGLASVSATSMKGSWWDRVKQGLQESWNRHKTFVSWIVGTFKPPASSEGDSDSVLPSGSENWTPDDVTERTRQDPNKARLYAQRALLYFRDDMFEDAIADFTQAIRLAPDDAKLYAMRGEAYFCFNDLYQSLADLHEAISRKPAFSTALNSRWAVFAELKNFDRAIEDVSAAIELDALNSELYQHRARIQLETRKLDAAISDLDMACQLNPHAEANRYLHGEALYRRADRVW